MRRALLILLTAAVFDVGEMEMSSLSVSSGSSLTLPTSCTFHPSNGYELYIGKQIIGSYMNHYLFSRLQFSTRLQFGQEKCSFILKNLTEEDSNVYTFITKYQKEQRIVHREEHFNVTVTEPMTYESPVNHSSQHYEDSIYGSLAVCFLLDTPVAMLLMGIHCLLLWLVKKCAKMFPEVRPSCLHHVFEFILGDPVKIAAISGFKFGGYFSLVFQLVATVLFIVWNICGQGHGTRVVWPILSAISFLVEMVMTYSRCCCTCLLEMLRCCPLCVMLLRPLLISGSIVVAFSLIYYDIMVIRNMWYLGAALISLSVRAVLMVFFYWKLKSRNDTNNPTKSDPTSLLRPQEPPQA